MSVPISPTVLRLGTRASLLARTQSGLVANWIEQRHPGTRVELTIYKTSGDVIAERPLHEFGGKGLFTKELEQALLEGQIDLAVHSFKDVPVTMPLVEQDELIIAAVPAREDARDVLVSFKGATIHQLPRGATVGTGSLRRRSQLLALRPDLQVLPIRGNIDTRLRKLQAGDFDAVILAAAGLRRASLFDPDFMYFIDPEILMPASGQGALAIECRRQDQQTRQLVSVLNDSTTATCVSAERELVKLLEGDCHSPISAYAELEHGELMLRAAVGGRGGEPPVVRTTVRGPAENPMQVAQMANQALGTRARTLLHGHE